MAMFRFQVARLGAMRSGSVGQGGERRDRPRHGRELETVDRAFNECHFECSAGQRSAGYGRARTGLAWFGVGGQGLTTADRTF
jgi:hypothetical protein